MRRHLLLVLPLLACGPKTTAPTAAAPAPSGDSTMVRMFQHSADLQTAQRNLVLGNEEPALAVLASFAGRDAPSDLRADLRPYYERMQATASRYERADTVATTARVLAETLGRCGECHDAAGAEMPVLPTTVPTGEGVRAHMQRHQWAVERLTEGLLGPSDGRWKEGGNVLYEDALAAKEAGVPASDDPAIQVLADQVHDVGAYAHQRTVTEDRVTILGKLWVTCAECHERSGLGQ